MSARFPDSETVAVQYVRRVSDAAASTTLPATLPTGGFVQVTVLGGSPDIYTLQRNPLVQIDCWAGTENKSNNPPYATASALAEQVHNAIASSTDAGVFKLTGFYPFYVQSVYMVSEPRRVEDSRGYARYTMDAEFYWSTDTIGA